MPLIEGKLGQKHRVAGKLIVGVQQSYRIPGYHYEYIHVIRIVGQGHGTFLSGSEIVCSWSKCMPHDAVSAGRPVIRCGRSHSSVGPAVLIYDVDDTSLVREASVLHASAVKILIGGLGQRKDGAGLASAALEDHGSSLTQNLLTAAQVGNGHHSGLLVERDTDNSCRQMPGVRILPDSVGDPSAGIADKNLGRRLCLWITDYASVVIPEKTEDIRSIKVHCHTVTVTEDNLGSRRIEAPCLFC